MRLYNIGTPLVAITGGVASGKSTVSKIFQAEGHQVISADEIIKKIYEKNGTLEWMRQNHPEFVDQGKIKLKELSQAAFANQELLRVLENFLYPQMEEEFLKLVPEVLPPYLIYEIPLLFEKKKESAFDAIILVTCPLADQQQRLRERNQLSAEQAQNIIDNQIPWEQKSEKSHFIIDNSGSLKDLETKTKQVIQSLKEKFQ